MTPELTFKHLMKSKFSFCANSNHDAGLSGVGNEKDLRQ